MKVLVINAGSSSLKYQLIEPETATVLAKGLCERIGIDGRISHRPTGKDRYEAEVPMKTHSDAIQTVIGLLVSPEYGVIKSLSDIDAVGHRVAHAGEAFSDSALITPEVYKTLEGYIPLAPLHNPANLLGVTACAAVMGDIPQVGVFDTAFHQTMPPEAYIYALPYEYYEKYQIRRYGFHGTSHRYVSDRAAKLLGKNIEDLKIITCHLGNGSSLCAVKYGKSIDTSMGFTPIEGLPMGTRTGNIDPGIMLYMMDDLHLDPHGLVKVINKESGVLGISGVSPDFRDLHAAAAEGNKRAALALDKFAYEVRKTIGAYAAAMDGVDVILFTGGVGENDSVIRAKAVEGLEYMGVKLDEEKNDGFRDEGVISTPDSRVAVMVVPTNEELMIALDTMRLVNA